MKVTDEAIQALYELAGETNVNAPDSAKAWEVMGLCQIALDGYAERRAAIEYARARGLNVTRVCWCVDDKPPANWCEDVSPEHAEGQLGDGCEYRIEIFPDRDSIDAARDECADLIAAGWKPQGGAS